MEAEPNPKKGSSISIIAGVNGAGKSSIGGAAIREAGGVYYNPDEAARKFISDHPGASQTEANSAAWRLGVRLLARAIDEGLDFVFESTLGGNTISRMLSEAALQGIEVHVWFVGLESPELHIDRVRRRVSKGGHHIPEKDIRRRYEGSRINLIDLIPLLKSLRVFDNSFEANPDTGNAPKPLLVLHMEDGQIVGPKDLAQTPDWAKPIVAAAIKHSRS